ncbi:TPA: AlpA family phage regulatory protein [Klebsiella pneumoniae]|uniref:AlpA family phage regulatory protein n=1 Tax=Klebsiella pneumoniae TaxID=573 RepID=A0A483GWL1_KLEPN|nr:AlpA family phage regulatory protein [Klebsiella pneumoniae]HBQ5938185.1 AlpA family phage regulatory protein [Klebsiella pneumoniae subsp. pneumoniae]HDS8943867.1 AlpA family phage regulatory protein [Klebsiella pneumoniae subsp. ozaenae]SBI83486.1 Predicted transcriptional regulator [Klebsiella pneumoniae]HBS6056783.1 AlpA family phage regulatory protein [Klebsiella pneumoniae]
MKNDITKRFIRVPEVLRRVGFGRTKLYELIRQGRLILPSNSGHATK